jgi:hypothetical protein
MISTKTNSLSLLFESDTLSQAMKGIAMKVVNKQRISVEEGLRCTAKESLVF